MHFYKVLIYGEIKGYISASNEVAAKRKVLKDKKYSHMLWHGKTKITNLKLVRVI